MSNVNKHITIPKNVSSNDDLSFDFLRQKGIEYIQSLGSQFWTDYNTHDPGITILEVLSYAITDLGMRINLPINDLLSDGKNNSFENQFFSASEILPNKALTAFDYRKIIIDIDPKRIKNCWLQTTTKKLFVDCKEGKISLNKHDLSSENYIKETDVKGFYTFLIDFDITQKDVEEEKTRLLIKNSKIKNPAKKELYDEDKLRKKVWEEMLQTKILEKYHQNRNLCEDIDEVKEVEEYPISICAQIEIHPDADEEMVYAHITIELEKHLAPSLQFYSLKEMTEKKYTSDQIFEGPLLQNGFIDEKELQESSLRTEVRLSDVINIIMGIDGVRVINDISINNCGDEESTTENWNLCIPQNKKPKLCKKTTFSFKKGVLPVNVNKNKVDEYISDLKFDALEKQSKASENKELRIPTGVDYNSDDYSSVSHNFPETYGIGEVGLSETVSAERKVKAKQLKGYLLFFDQILTSYFKHLSNVKKLLSINNSLPKTYFTQAVTDIKGFEDLVTNYNLSNEDTLCEDLFGHLDDSIKRQNQLKDHLIARFAERFSEYTFLMKSLYGSTSDVIVLQNKADFLSNYDTISSQRGCAFNYYKQPLTNLWNTFNVSGLENRIAGLLGIKGDVTPTGKKGIKRQRLTNVHFQIYDPTPDTPADSFRWRIRNANAKIILTATENYSTEEQAIKEMNIAIQKIQQVNESDINDGFKTLIKNRDAGTPFKDTVIKNFEVIESDTHRYSFHIINPKLQSDLDNPDRIIARQYKLFNTLEETQDAMIKIISFFKQEYDKEGIFLVEHLLLLPKEDEENSPEHYLSICIDDCSDDCCIPDPYSFKISVILPGYTYRFSDVDFRNFAEDIIRQEIPSHILGKICWIGHRNGSIADEENDLLRFEKTFEQFLLDKSKDKQDHLPQFIEALGELNSIYNVGELFDCEDESDDITGKIILGRTNLGTL